MSEADDSRRVIRDLFECSAVWRDAGDWDRLRNVDPSAAVTLDAAVLGRLPEGYRHLTYLQTQGGYEVKADMPGLEEPALDALYARRAGWLRGGACATGV